jgi:YgiT-type zinc finger domain-containing protein
MSPAAHKNSYNDCRICGGHVKEVRQRKDHYWKDKVAVFNDVPTGQCQKCRSSYYRPEVRARLDKLTRRPPTNAQYISVPLVRYANVPRSL